MKKRLLTAFLCLCMVFAMLPTAVLAEDSNVWDGTVAAGFDGGTGTETDPYLISNGAQLAYLAQTVNSGTGYSGEYFKLTSDIVLNDTTDWESWDKDTANLNKWTPIGADSNSFTGTFDGNGHTVSGMYVSISDNSSASFYVGLFGYNTGTIKNTGIEKSYVYVKTTGNNSYVYVAGVAGYNTGSITNCYNSGNVFSFSANSFAAGIAGYNTDNGNIDTCCNSGEIAADGNYIMAGGIAGLSYGSISNCNNSGTISSPGDNFRNVYFGGIAGTSGGSVASCCNSGDINAGNVDSPCYVLITGGLVGYLTDNGSILDCHNTGGITAASSQIANIGGLAGYLYNSSVINSYNTGDINTTDITIAYVGGLAGCLYNNSSVTNCYNAGNIKTDTSSSVYIGGLTGYIDDTNGSAANCYSTGIINVSNADTSRTGGLAGSNKKGSINGCYYLKTNDINAGLRDVGDGSAVNCDTFSGPAEPDADVSYQGNADKIPLLTALNNWVDSQDGTTAYNSWAADSSINNGYPVFGYIVSNDLTGLTSSGSEGIPLSIYDPMNDYTAVLTADEGYMLPDSITVKVDDTELDPTTEYTYDNTTGQLTIDGASITGNIEIIAVGIEKIYAISVDPAALDFGSADTGYSALAAKTVKITNTGNTDIIVDLPADTDHFTIEAGNGFSDGKVNIATGETASFAVTPKTGLAAGTYDDTISIEGDHETGASVTAGLTVTKAESGAASTGTDTQSGTSVKTGVTDNTGMTIVIVLILCSAIGGIVYVYRKRKGE